MASEQMINNDSQVSAPSPTPPARRMPIFRTAKLSSHDALPPADTPIDEVAAVSEPSKEPAIATAIERVSVTSSIQGAGSAEAKADEASPIMVSPTPPGAKRMTFAALDKKQALNDAVASVSTPSDFPTVRPVEPVQPAAREPQSKASISTAQKTEDAVTEMRMLKEMAAAKKAKGQLDMAKFGLYNEAQWLLFSPGRYDDYTTSITEFKNLNQGNVAVVKGKITEKTLFDDKKNKTTNVKAAVRLTVTLQDTQGKTILVSAFGRPGFAWKNHNVDDFVVIRAKPQRAFAGYGLELPNPEIVSKDLLGQVVPIYPPLRVTKGEKFDLQVKRHYDLIDTAAQIVEADSGWHDKNGPVSMTELTGFDTGKDLLRNLHRPKNVRDGEKAMRGAKLLSSYTLVRKTAERAKDIKVDARSIVNIDLAEVERLKTRFPFPLTRDQVDTVDGICKALRGPKPMDGLLSGDVGTGKTAAFMLPMVAAFKAGKRVMLLTPNLLLISQFVREIGIYFPEVPVCTVKGKVGKKGGVEGDPEKSIVVGTTALVNAMKKGIVGKKPDFLVVDEQHKFSVEQREALRDLHTNKIEATATPIPRTAALATHGAHDLFLLRDVPVKKLIKTEVLGADQGKRAGQAVIDALRRNEQAAVIYPLVNASGDVVEGKQDDAKKAVNNAADHWKRFVPIENIAVLHGKMTDAEKEEVLNDFREGRKQLLLSSIVIEVGVTLPDLKTMLVTDADRFGVVTLHQLRGRLARHGGEGHFILFSENTEDPEAMERLQLVADNSDGFDLAEKDAEIRGFGDILGIDGDNQSGATRTLFQGVKIGPRDISFAANLFEKAMVLGDADEFNAVVKKGQNMRLM